MIVLLLASINRIKFLKSFFGICESLLQSKALPELLIQIFVALAVARPIAMCTWIGSKGLFSFD